MDTFAAPVLPFWSYGSIGSSYHVSGYDVRVADVLFIIKTDELTSHRYAFSTHKMCLLFFGVVMVIHVEQTECVSSPNSRLARLITTKPSSTYIWMDDKKYDNLHMHAIATNEANHYLTNWILPIAFAERFEHTNLHYHETRPY